MAMYPLPEAERYTRQNRLRQIWRKLIRVMACIVVFCTTYALILPAITMEKTPVCGLDAHTHSESCYTRTPAEQVTTLACTYESLGVHVHSPDCYDEQEALVCGLQDFVAHIHDDSCADADGTLVCALPEISVHIHAEACYGTAEDGEAILVCAETTAPWHSHTGTCFVTTEISGETQTLTCPLTEHTHTDACVSREAAEALALEEDADNYPYIAPAADTTVTVDNVNYYEPGQVVLIDGYTVSEFNDPAYTITFTDAGRLNQAAKDSFTAAQPDFTGYTAVVIENLDNGQDKYIQYYVDAVITCAADTIMNPNTDMTTLAPKTDRGFIVYIPNALVTEDDLPARGDLVTPNFWHGSPDLIVGFAGNADIAAAGTLSFAGNPAAEEVLTAAEPTALNATVKMFDYGRDINSVHPDEFLFWNGDYGFGADLESVDGWGADFILVDDQWVGAWPYTWENPQNISMEAYHGYNRFPAMAAGLSGKGYPQILDRNPDNAGNILELDYLFDGRYQTGSAMTDGGGLFQQDADGYYYYDSLQNAAYFDAEASRFTLYRDLIVRPWADSNDASRQAYGNFLPLNPITAHNITLDGYVFDDIAADLTLSDDGALTGGMVTGWQGSLAAEGGQSYNSVNATLESDGNNRLSQSVYENGKYTARLEEKANLWFGMTVDFEFYQPEDGVIDNVLTEETDYSDMVFDFHGDDDVLVYVGVWNDDTQEYDYRLVLDLAGVHEARSGNINFASGAVHYQKHNADTDTEDDQHVTGTGSVEVSTTLGQIFGLDTDTFADHTKLAIKFFYLERGGNISYCRLRFNIPTLPQRSLTVTKELAVPEGELKNFLENTYTYEFRVMKSGQEPMIRAGSTYEILEDGLVTGTGTVGADGWFGLRAGQSARFANMAALTDGYQTDYFVEERLPANLTGQYGGVEYTIGSGEHTIITPETTASFTTFRTGLLQADDTRQVIYRNVVDTTRLGTLTITKRAAEGADLDTSMGFRIRVKLDGRLLPAGTAYTLTAADGTETLKTVEEDGIIVLRVDETASIVRGILAGTAYEVTEPDAGTGFFASYAGTVTADGTVNVSASGVTGTFPVGGTAQIAITNSDYRYAVRIPISKQALHNDIEETFFFEVASAMPDGDGWTVGEQLEQTGIRVTDDTVKTGEFFLTFRDVEPGTYWFRVSELAGEGDFLYDDTFYIVGVTVADGEAAVTQVLQNGTDAMETSGILSFVNRKLTQISVSKTVTGVTPPANLRFGFTASVTNPDGSVFIPAAAEGYTVAEDGTISFELADRETLTISGIPIGAVVTVTETLRPGYAPSWAVNGSAPTEGTTAAVEAAAADTIAFYNYCAYLLPETGGSGITMYTLAGLMLMLCSMAVLLYRFKKRGREVI